MLPSENGFPNPLLPPTFSLAPNQSIDFNMSISDPNEIRLTIKTSTVNGIFTQATGTGLIAGQPCILAATGAGGSITMSAEL